MVDLIHGTPAEPLNYPFLPRGRCGGSNSTSYFQQILSQKLEEGNQDLKFSSHAIQRLASRQINLTCYDLSRISGAVERAKAKGAKDSLILLGNLAFVVSVENRTVITALVDSSLRERVFTQIDSAVIA